MPYDFTHMRRKKKKKKKQMSKQGKQTNKALIDTVNNWWLLEARGDRAEEADKW